MIAKKFSKGIKQSLKDVVKDKRAFRRIIFFTLLLVIAYASWSFFRPNYGPSYLKKSAVKIIKEEVEANSIVKEVAEVVPEEVEKNVFHAPPIEQVQDIQRHSSRPHRMAKQGRVNRKVEYRAPQVIVRDSAIGDGNALPVRTNLIGTLLMSIDTRLDDTSVRVILPYGSKNVGGIVIPKGTILQGSYQPYQGGERLYVRFTSCLFPDGNEYQIEAQALDSSDYRSGIKGQYHSNSTSRIATTLGLSMVAGVSEVFTDRVVLGDGYSVTPKASLKNAFAQGTAKAANTELERQVNGMGQGGSEYLTIESTKEVIVSLTKAFRGEKVVR